MANDLMTCRRHLLRQLVQIVGTTSEKKTFQPLRQICGAVEVAVSLVDSSSEVSLWHLTKEKKLVPSRTVDVTVTCRSLGSSGSRVDLFAFLMAPPVSRVALMKLPRMTESLGCMVELTVE